VLPDYGGACISEVVPALLHLEDFASGRLEAPAWLPKPLLGAKQVVLLVLDGLGWDQLREKSAHAPFLSSMEGGAITSVVPSTTASGLTSIVTGTSPSAHGLVGYRLKANGEVLNVLKWETPSGDARTTVPPTTFQEAVPFFGHKPPVVCRAEFADSGFTCAHLAGLSLHGWRMPSSMFVEVRNLARSGALFIYAYYDGIDKIAHDKGLGEYFDAELTATDEIAERLFAGLPKGCVLAVTADHGQVEVNDDPIVIEKEILADVTMLSGEGRFRWLDVVPGALERVRDACLRAYGEIAWVRTRDELDTQGWFGEPLRPHIAERLGDVALIARAPVAFFDPDDTGDMRLVARHGSQTRAEMYIPFIALAS
jgi:predicted AlkP superfamily pyrophosphatase or phosphodiesterase